jgi:hypothetical protein
MKVGSKVYLYYDGKSARETTGVITALRGFAMKVKFQPWASKFGEVEGWFVKRKKYETWCGTVKVKDSVMKMLGIAEGDFYAVWLKSLRSGV